mgnify:CR=1 FL=1
MDELRIYIIDPFIQQVLKKGLSHICNETILTKGASP